MGHATMAIKNESFVTNQVQKEIKELKSKLFKQENVLGEALIKLEKASTVLNHWEQNYSFSKRPSPEAAIAWRGTVRSEDIWGQQSFTWYQEYNLIFQLISIASDYVYESKKLLEQIVDVGICPLEF